MVETAPQLAEAAAHTDLLGVLGIDWKLFLAQLVNFGLVTLVLWKWAYKPAVDMLDKRKKSIAESLAKAEEIDRRMKRIGAEEGAMMKEAHEKAQAVLVAAEASAKEHMASEVEKTRKQVETMLEAGRAELSAMKAHLLTETKQELADVVTVAVEKIVGETADKKTHAELVKKAAALLSK